MNNYYYGYHPYMQYPYYYPSPGVYGQYGTGMVNGSIVPAAVDESVIMNGGVMDPRIIQARLDALEQHRYLQQQQLQEYYQQAYNAARKQNLSAKEANKEFLEKSTRVWQAQTAAIHAMTSSGPSTNPSNAASASESTAASSTETAQDSHGQDTHAEDSSPAVTAVAASSPQPAAINAKEGTQEVVTAPQSKGDSPPTASSPDASDKASSPSSASPSSCSEKEQQTGTSGSSNKPPQEVLYEFVL
ncbi:TPA: hypothetical protein N0F65_009554 [Lagenidium giganteum]|uniref:Uncharacterized protein n=1 Tax=Lagenidium giganteum TaxID=4803 RepID=A0AAV2YMF1_9STRA|nr:TPA: hypothetical protein N0F65_009554 [Lagenidium giganteum]